jgi:peroxiredoxin
MNKLHPHTTMKINYLYLTGLIILLSSCNQDSPQEKRVDNKVETYTNASYIAAPVKLGTPIIAGADITRSMDRFWDYYTSNIKLFDEFIASDARSRRISKGKFLALMTEGQYYPLVLHSAGAVPHYQLKKIPEQADQYISLYMRQFSVEQLKYYNMIGKPIPKFDFTAVDGTRYTTENTKGKTVVFKCWFIGCKTCVAEMPALNEMVEEYRDNQDILFISLAMDSKDDLKHFLSKTDFKYETVPNQSDYMRDDLQVLNYPTHFLIDQNGILIKVLPDARELKKALANQIVRVRTELVLNR